MVSGVSPIIVVNEATNVTVGGTVPIEKTVDVLSNCNSPNLITISNDLGHGPSTSHVVFSDKDLVQKEDLRESISELYNKISDKQLWSLLDGEKGNESEILEGANFKTPLQFFAHNPESQSSTCSIQPIRSNVTLRKGKKKQWARLKGGTCLLEPVSPILNRLDLSEADNSSRDLRAMSLGQGSK